MLQEDTAIGVEDVIGPGASERRGGRLDPLLAAFDLDEDPHRRLVDRHDDVVVRELLAVLFVAEPDVQAELLKNREEFAAEDVIIAIDETPVGTFVEIEGGEAHIHRTAAALGKTARDYITDSYRTLFTEYCRAHGIAPTNMLFASMHAPAGTTVAE